jgi:hypothetical protein
VGEKAEPEKKEDRHLCGFAKVPVLFSPRPCARHLRRGDEVTTLLLQRIEALQPIPKGNPHEQDNHD